MNNQIGQATILNVDCMEYMATLDDNAFDLVICDPPYGIGMDGGNIGYKGFNDFKKKDWDKLPPNNDFFKEIKRVSFNQIIWGGNYFESIWPTRSYIVWDKGAGFRNRTYAESELAFTSFDRNAKTFSHDPLAKGDYKGKIHPTQKPIKLYEWLLTNYAKPGQTILDTHLGSGSSAIACNNLGFKMVGCELDEDYYKASIERIKHHSSQSRLFA